MRFNGFKNRTISIVFICSAGMLLSSCTAFIEAWAKVSGSTNLSSTANSNTPPTTNALTPASFNEDIQSIITLPYTDVENDNAISCTVTNLSNVTITQACSCDLSGLCTVGVTGLSDYNGAAGFNYSVATASGSSNTSSVTLVIDPVNDLPVITVPNNLIYPLDGTDEPMVQGNQYILSFGATDSKDNETIISLSCTIQSYGMNILDSNYIAAGTNCNTIESLTTTNSVLVKSTVGVVTNPGMNATGSLTWIPSSLQRGTFQISITADDGVATATTNFFVTIREPYTNGNSLAIALDASFSTTNTSISNTAPTVPRADGTLFDDLSAWLGLKGSNNGILASPNFNTSAPWSGVGNYSNPYKLNLNGVDDVLNLGSIWNTATRVAFSMWVNPSNVSSPSSVLLSNGGGTGNGLVLRQSRTGSGQLELELGNVAANYSATVLADTPIAYWRLSDVVATVSDTSGANYCSASACDGTAGGTYAQSAVGGLAKDTNTAIRMGSDGYVDFGDNFNFGNAGTDTPFSIEFWINRNNADSGWINWRYIFSKTETGIAEYNIKFSDTLVNIVLSSPNGANWIMANANHNIIPGTWNHVIATYDGSKTAAGLKFFINGKSVSTLTSSGGAYNGMSDTASTARIGQLPILPYDLDGTTIDEVAIYNYALDATKAQNHYFAGAGCRTETPMTNNKWHHIAGIWTSTNLQLFINGAKECDYPTAGSFSPPATDLFFGATAAKTNLFSGSVSDLKIQATSNGTAAATPTSVNSDALATMNRFRSVPLEEVIKNNLILHWDAAYANMGNGEQDCGLNLGNKNIQWFDISQNANNGMIQSGSHFACGSTGWAGSGIAADPYRFVLQPANAVFFEVPYFSTSSTTASFEFWIKADKQPNGVNETYDGLLGTNNAGLNLYYFTDQLGKMGWYSGGAFTTLNAVNAPTDTNWHQIVYVMNGVSSLGYLYIDGTLMNAGGTAFTPSLINANTMGIGRASASAYRLENPLSIVRIYQSALTQAEIRQNCHAQKNRFAGMVCAGP